MVNHILLVEKLDEFLNEDINFDDVSMRYLAGSNQIAGSFIAKQAGVVCGQTIPQAAYDLLGDATYTPIVADGELVVAGTVIGKVEGRAATLLTGERVILNLMQRMSGIASKTAEVIRKLDDPTIKITDTRKTAPGLRLFDKYAVAVGGGVNHRFDLTGGVMLKDNHIALAGGVTQAVKSVQRAVGPLTPIEVEVETETELREAISAKADVIMFDNQTPQTIKKWQQLVPDTIKIEASGGITEETISNFKGCGANYLSMGNLTNAVSPLDVSFLVQGAVKS
ncbi:carboxylating nicotinate-nucleotide diphosphorylase [Lentilactobacillus kisonensis]|uniref:nicotinate-nucleotide diphosphorylase (carboxylating) n=1 Tax=Lentilactobacillus kisonensis F0435 TaxID=797516 RepID=H1LFS7_9LACO|nr:nicotinate-nucleotide diphosphorylase [Lentilactobacillus kisonensis F0435]